MTFLRKSGARDSGRAHDPTRPRHRRRRLMELDEFRAGLDRWLDEHEAELAPAERAATSLDEQMAHLSKVKRLTFDAGWMRWGWPERSAASAARRCCAATSARR